MSFEFLADPNARVTLFTLSALEIVLGIDNLVFISIAVSKLPEERRPFARKLGIAVACITRIALLVSLAYRRTWRPTCSPWPAWASPSATGADRWWPVPDHQGLHGDQGADQRRRG